MKALNRITILFLLFIIINKTQAQVGIGINPPDPSAMLHVQATDKGILIPRMTEAQRIAIQNPAEGLEVYQTNNTKGFWYFTDGQWKSLASPSNNGGKHTLYLADDITDAQAIAKIAADVGPNTQEVRILRCTNLTTVDLSMITSLTEIYISGNTALQSVNFDNVQAVDGGIYVDQCPALTSIPISHIKNIGQTVNGTYGLQISNTGLVNFNTPLIAKINGTININNNNALTAISFPFITEHPVSSSGANIDAFRITQNNTLTSISLPLLATCSDLYIGNNNTLSTVSIPLLTTSRYLYIFSNVMLNTISAASLISLNNLYISANSNLPSLNLPALANVSILTIMSNLLTTPLSFPVLKKIGILTIGANTGLTSILFPVLDSVSSTFSIGGSTSLTSLSCPVMVKVGDIQVNGNAALSSFTLPLLNKISDVTSTNTISQNSGLVSLSLPALVICAGDLRISNNINLVSISFDALTTLGNTWYYHYYDGNKFSSAGVNYILHKLATVTGGPVSGDQILLAQIVPAPPTGQGITDENILLARGCYVVTD